MRKPAQDVLHCRCGEAKLRARGMCAACCSRRQRDNHYFGGHHEKVLKRDGYRCRVCDASGRDKRSIIVHHRVPGKSVLHLMISLCPACHAKIHHTRVVIRLMPPLLLELWRELHPKGHEQTALNFSPKRPFAQVVALFSAE